MILAGDIGGTKTHLALYDWTTERSDPQRIETFHSTDYASLEEMLAEFLSPPKAPLSVDQIDTVEQEEPSAAQETAPVRITANERPSVSSRMSYLRVEHALNGNASVAPG